MLKKLESQLQENAINNTSYAFSLIRKEIKAQEERYRFQRENSHQKQNLEVNKAKKKADEARKKLAKIKLADLMDELN